MNNFRYFKITADKNVVTFEHVHAEAKKLRGVATLDAVSGVTTVNGKYKNLIGYFAGYYVKKYSYCDIRNRLNMKSDLYEIQEAWVRDLLVRDIVDSFSCVSKINSTSLGVMLKHYISMKNFIDWRQAGYNIDSATDLTMSMFTKETRTVLKDSRVDVSELDVTSETIKDFNDFVLCCVNEKVPHGVDRYVDNKWANWCDLFEEFSKIITLKRHGYTYSALLRYMFNYVTIYENLAVSTALNELKDYADMHMQMGVTDYKKYPKYLKSMHDIAAREFSSFKKSYDERRFRDRVRVELDYYSDEFLVAAPCSTDEVKDEGKQLGHCVGSYIDRIVEGKTQILFLRTDVDKSRVTLEVRDDVLIQARGASNREPTKEEREMIEKYAVARNLAVRI